MRNRQLFTLVRDIETNLHAFHNSQAGKYEIIQDSFPAGFAVYWPNGTPCLAVEWFLTDISQYVTIRRNDGGTLKGMVSDLSHLIRFCGKNEISFENLTDENFNDFISILHTEAAYATGARSRNRTTIRRIIVNSMNFLQWYQENLELDRIVIGPRNLSPQITAKISNRGSAPPYVTWNLLHPLMPPKDPPIIKTPISSEIITRLWDTVAELSSTDSLLSKPECHNLNRQDQVEDINYLRARRELLLLILESTGCRIGEAARIDISKNSNCAGSSQLVLTTLKRRTKKKIYRKIPVDRGVAIKVEQFIKGPRAKLLARLKRRGASPPTSNKLFLCSRKGVAISEGSLSREFSRIVNKANITQRTCFSMFRHRFITNMVAMHLKAFSSENSGKVRALFTESDYRSILKKVAHFTGHANEESLLPYITLAWDIIGVFDATQLANEMIQNVDSSIRQIQSLLASAKNKRDARPEDLAAMLLAELEGLKQRATQNTQRPSETRL